MSYGGQPIGGISDDDLVNFSPDQLYSRYSWYVNVEGAVPTAPTEVLSTLDKNNLFAYQTGKQFLGRVPTSTEFIASLPAAATGKGDVISYYTQLAATLNNQSTATAAPPSQSGPNDSMAATGIAAMGTSTPGGTPGSYASVYSYGSAPTTFAAPPSDNSGMVLAVLAGAVILYMTVFKHG